MADAKPLTFTHGRMRKRRLLTMYKTLLFKMLALVAPFAILIIALAAHLDRSVKLREGVFNSELEGKFRALLKPDVEVIIAGDSRAERQVIPSVFESLTGQKAANVAVIAGDVITLRNAVRRHGMPSRTRILILSASLFQMNDGAIERGFLSKACVLNMTLREKLTVYRNALRSLLADMTEVSIRREEAPQVISEVALRQQGFWGVDGKLSLPVTIILDPETTNHPWYRDLSLHGARWRIFREALRELAEFNIRIYVFDPPISPAWRAYSAGSFIDLGERELAAMLRRETGLYPNLRFLDFYSAPDGRLTDEDFYDIQHVNRGGAEKFTEMLAEKIRADLP
jgi:hypothetical protein